MNKLFVSLLLTASAPALFAHPMGNFSVSHYANLQVSPSGAELEYALDLAEIPTFELLREWNLERTSATLVLEAKAREQAREWLRNLAITSEGKPLHVKFEGADLVITDGAGNLPILRITARAHLDTHGGALEYEDHNFPDRAGWKEIVIAGGKGTILRKASQSNRDISKALTQYPPDPTLAPPQDLRAELEWTATRPVIAASKSIQPIIAPVAQPMPLRPAPSPATMTAKSAPPGSVVRGDFLSRLLHKNQLTPWMILIAIAVSFALGAAHALTPGHGKTIVAAYLVGSRGTLKHAAFLGAMVTFTHTITVFALGLATLFLFRFIVPERITEILGALSGLSIVGVGGWMLYKRIRGAGHSQSHSHGPHHHHDHDHHPHHDHGHEHHDHHHHPHSHSHVPDEISWGGLIALGASGGLVPCESALVLLLGAIALGRVALGLLLLVSFSLGLALVLMMIGILVLYAKNLLPERKRTAGSPLFRWLPVASAAAVMIVGLVMTGVSLGWIQPKWMIG
ncbi:MAG: sulfite exporter TauE/SafE family protein [Bryobacteraceae bacterium]